MNPINIWTNLLPYSHACKQAEFNLGTQLVRHYDQGLISFDDVKHLITESVLDRNKKPSDATTFRYLAKWREILTSLSNPGNGA